jgi:hypothetical protein
VWGGAGALSVVAFGPWRIDTGGLRLSASDTDKPLMILAVAGLAAIVISRTALDAVRRRSVAGFYLGASIVMWMFALGPTVMLNGVPRAVPGPFRLLFLLPGGGGVRVPGRFWLMSTLCLSIVAGLAASRLLARRRPRAAMLTAVLALGLISDGWTTIPAAPVPAPFPDEAALRGQTVLALPVGEFQDFGPQFRAVVGGWRSVNGYSGYEPRFYEAVRQGTRFEVEGLFAPFRARGDLIVIVNTDHPRLVSMVERQHGAVCIADKKGTRQYRLPRQEMPAPATRTPRCSASRRPPHRAPRLKRPSTAIPTRVGCAVPRMGGSGSWPTSAQPPDACPPSATRWASRTASFRARLVGRDVARWRDVGAGAGPATSSPRRSKARWRTR